MGSLTTYQISKFDTPFHLFISHISCSCRAEEDSKIAIESFSYDCV